MTSYKVTSEIFTENENFSQMIQNDSAISTFVFKCPSYMIDQKHGEDSVTFDNDDDLDIDREKEGSLLIEHRVSTELQHVGLQIWRGGLLLADYILSNPDLFKSKIVLELGSGVGLTSIVASFLAKEVICTDVDIGGMLKLIESNFLRNTAYVKSKFYIQELDFLNLQWSTILGKRIDTATVILAADVIYDDEITQGFVRTLAKLLNSKTQKTVYIALEKRYVFTVTDLDTAAPMYEEFLQCIERQQFKWHIEYIKIDFPRYFKYDRVKQMILMKIQNEPHASELC